MSDLQQVPPEEKELTLKQARWLKFYIETGNATEAARLAGYTCENEDSFRVIGHVNLTKVNSSQLLEEMGLSKQRLLKVISLGITRSTKKVLKKTRTYFKEPVDGNGVVKYTKDSKGRLVVMGTEMITEMEYEDVIDFDARRKNAELALKLHEGGLKNQAPQKNELSFGENTTVQIVNYNDKQLIEMKSPVTVVGQKEE